MRFTVEANQDQLRALQAELALRNSPPAATDKTWTLEELAQEFFNNGTHVLVSNHKAQLTQRISAALHEAHPDVVAEVRQKLGV